MKINLTPAYTERATLARAAILAQQRQIADLRATVPTLEAEAKASAQNVEKVRQAANPRDDKAVKLLAEANTRAELWQAEIVKTEKAIKEAVEGLKPLCRDAWLCLVAVVDELLPALQEEIAIFHRRHFELARTAEFRASEVDSVRILEALKNFDAHHRGDIETEGAPACIYMLEELLGEHNGVRSFLFDGSEVSIPTEA